ncbi:MAG: recombinase family protein [Candidatus Sericytochromatia bacterium]|nr:recombinase family protein [Candidatus Tanganyikabacteria bacterium]
MKAIGYIRVSTEEQAEEGISLDAQRTALAAYCLMRGLELIEIVADPGVSAGKPLTDRAGGRRVLEAVARDEVGAVVALKLDRLFRDCVDCLTVTAGWDKAAVALHLIDLGGQAIDTSTAMGRFFLTVMAGAAEMERNLIRERTRTAMAELKRQGQAVSRPGYGQRIEAGRLVNDEAEAAVIARARELRGAGLTLQGIADTLTAEGVPTKRGGTWAPATVAGILKRAL